jgi:hypothetical protein
MPVTIDTRQNLVLIDGFRFEGWIDRQSCATCGEVRVYYLVYDAFFCPACNAWLELRCADPACDVCACRPERPLGG